MRSCHTVLHPDTDDRALRATEARCAWVEHDAEHGDPPLLTDGREIWITVERAYDVRV